MMNKPDFRFIGKPVRRAEDERLITGRGQFTDDFLLERQTHAAMVRSPYPHARIRSIDTARAKTMKGVLAVLTGADCLAEKLGPIPHDPLPKTRDDMKLSAPGGGTVFIGPHMLLPADKARHVGEAVAMVVAETRNQAMDAAEAVEVDYEELPFVIHAEDALKPGAPAVWDELPGNMPVETFFGDRAATDQAFAQADHVIKLDFHIGRVTGVPIELRSANAHYDKATGRYTLYAGSGGAVRQKNELSTVLGIKPDELRVLSYDVGGNFGTRNRVFVEFGLVLWAAKKIGRPVKYTATRSEAFLSDYQGRDLVTKVELALRKDGKFLAMRAENISNIGARAVSFSPLSKGAGLIPGNYDIPAATLRAVAVFTHTMPTQAYRSSGRPEVTYAIERLIDNAAAELGFDRVSLRRKNLIKPKALPYRNAVGMLYDSGEYEKNMNWAMELAGWKDFAKRRREARKRGKLLGLGPRQLHRVLHRRAARAGADFCAPGGPRRRGDRHPAERAGARDELCAGGVRSAEGAGRARQNHPRRHRRGEGRRRLAFRPLHAPRRDGVLVSRGRPDRQGQEDRRAGDERGSRLHRVHRRRPLHLARHQPQLRFPGAGEGGGKPHASEARGRRCCALSLQGRGHDGRSTDTVG